uniref:Uncharacterized protein n=1 Tax=Neogobius melanostomus TaxID=47308 RepID=A0A8C6TXI2_9GOBI
ISDLCHMLYPRIDVCGSGLSLGEVRAELLKLNANCSPPMDTRTRYAVGIVTLFPSLKDPFTPKGHVLQDFELMFGKETSSKLVEKWGAILKSKVIKEAKALNKTATLNALIRAAEGRK